MVTSTVEKELAERTSGPRLFALDALRGFAACLVVAHHFRLCFFNGEPRWYLREFFPGTASVALFFVLSGYVLSIPYWQGRQIPYPRYIVRRFFRIYVPYAVALIIALIAARHFLFSSLPLTPWFYRMWHTPLTRGLIWRHFLTIPGSGEVNTAIWSLRYEFEMSLLLPLICPVVLWLKGWWPLLLTFGISIAGRYIQSHAALRSPALAEVGWSLVWISFFLYGTLLSWQQRRIGEFYEGLPSWVRIVLAVIALIIFSSPRLMLIAAAACVLVLTALHTRVKGWLTTPFPEYLGRISYSMYLTHSIVLFIVVILFYGKLPFPALVLLFAVITFAASHLFCVSVEEPANILGRYLTRSRKDRIAATAIPPVLADHPSPR